MTTILRSILACLTITAVVTAGAAQGTAAAQKKSYYWFFVRDYDTPLYAKPSIDSTVVGRVQRGYTLAIPRLDHRPSPLAQSSEWLYYPGEKGVPSAHEFAPERAAGWLKTSALLKIKDFDKATEWPIRLLVWMPNELMGDAYCFTREGRVKWWSFGHEPPSRELVWESQLYIHRDTGILATVRMGESAEKGLGFLLYDATRQRLCPIGATAERCDQYYQWDYQMPPQYRWRQFLFADSSPESEWAYRTYCLGEDIDLPDNVWRHHEEIRRKHMDPAP